MDWTDVEKGISSQIFAIFDDFQSSSATLLYTFWKFLKKWRVYETWILGNQLITSSTRVHTYAHLNFKDSDIEFENF